MFPIPMFGDHFRFEPGKRHPRCHLSEHGVAAVSDGKHFTHIHYHDLRRLNAKYLLKLFLKKGEVVGGKYKRIAGKAIFLIGQDR